MPHSPASEVLSHIRVFDLTQVRSEPTAVRQLADRGADVMKIEMSASAGTDRELGGPRYNFDFQILHRKKHSITINLKKSQGRDLFQRLVNDADVVVENFRPGVPASQCRSLPLNSRWGFTRNIVGHTANAAYLVDNASGYVSEYFVGNLFPIGRHKVDSFDCP